MTQREDREYARKTLISPSNDFSKTRCSLSMKMRSESVGGSLSRPSTTYAGLSGTLPELKKRRSSNIHLPPTIPKSDVAMMYEKLSGLFETEGFEAFPSRGTVVHPTTLCVRCASHASLCVPCADIMTQEAVAFFRKSQAVGAYHLLDGAIKQAGAQKVLRFIVFRCWKNSIRLRKYGRDKRELFTTRAWHLTLMKAPFRNWVIYTRECQFERRDKKIEQLEDKVRVLEQQVLKLSADKNVMEKQVGVKLLHDTCMRVCYLTSEPILHACRFGICSWRRANPRCSRPARERESRNWRTCWRWSVSAWLD